MNALLPVAIVLGLAALLRPRSSSSSSSSADAAAIERAKRELDASEARLRELAARMRSLQIEGTTDDLPTLQVWLRRMSTGASDVQAIAGVTWPNGHYSEYPAIGFDPFPAAERLLAAISGEIGAGGAVDQLFGKGAAARLAKSRTSPDVLPPEQARARQRFWWAAPYPEHAKPGLGYDRAIKRPSDAQLDHWWNAIGKGGRKRLKVDYAAIQDHAPAGSEASKRQWWASIGKSKRGKFREPYEKSLGESVSDAVRSAAPAIATYVLPQALNLVVPGSGVAVSAALTAAKLAAGGKADAKALTDAALAAAGNPAAGVVADAIRTVQPRVVAEIKAGKAKREATAATVAKAKALSTVASTLKSPATQRALAKVGVRPDQSKRAANLFGAIQSATASLVSERRGDAAAAAAHRRAADAQAAAAGVAPELAAAGGKKLFYLALTPGD